MKLFCLLFGVLIASPLSAQDLDEAFPRITREWVDATGQFKVEGKLIGVTKTSIQLDTGGDDPITVPVVKLNADSQTAAKQAFSHFQVESMIRKIIQGLLDKVVEDMSPRNALPTQKMFIVTANAELRKTRMTLRYRIVTTKKNEKEEVSLRLEPLQKWIVTPDDFQAVGIPGVGGFLRGWTLYEKDLAVIDSSKIVPGKSVLEMTGTPALLFPVGRDFAWRGTGFKNGSDRKYTQTIQIGFALFEHKIKIVNPEVRDVLRNYKV